MHILPTRSPKTAKPARIANPTLHIARILASIEIYPTYAYFHLCSLSSNYVHTPRFSFFVSGSSEEVAYLYGVQKQPDNSPRN